MPARTAAAVWAVSSPTGVLISIVDTTHARGASLALTSGALRDLDPLDHAEIPVAFDRSAPRDRDRAGVGLDDDGVHVHALHGALAVDVRHGVEAQPRQRELEAGRVGGVDDQHAFPADEK